MAIRGFAAAVACMSTSVLVLVGCGKRGNESPPPAATPSPTATATTAATSRTTPATTTSASGATKVQPKDVEGHWTGDWGDMYLETDANGTTRGVYPYDLGTIQGTIKDGVFTGWWCESPSRKAPSDAGEVEFKFVRNSAGGLNLDGRWRYDSTGAWREDWDLRLVDTPVDEATRARLANTDQFCAKP
jgi:hypothetical protein